jgi:hypothetical protein
MRQDVTTSLIFLGTMLGCSGEVAGTEANGQGGSAGAISTGGASSQAGGVGQAGAAAGGTSGQTSSSVCSTPYCCVPVQLVASNVNVYQVSGSMRITLIIERKDAATATDNWSPNATITTPTGDTLNCITAASYPGSTRFVSLDCSTTTAATNLACGSSTTLQINLRSGGSSTASNCDLGLTLTYTVPVKCPTCPAISSYFSGLDCDQPAGSTCSYESAVYGGGTGLLPCFCNLDSTTGRRVWSCAVS